MLKARAGETAFRTFRWEASAETKGDHTLLDLGLIEATRPALIGYDALEQVTAAWKKDCAAVQSLLEDAFAFKAP